jgi:VWFA-related protein
MNLRRRITFFPLAALIGAARLATPASGPEIPAPDAPPPAQATPFPSSLVERVEVRFVQFDLIVERRGKGGWRRVTDLRQADVAVLLGGKPMPLEMFENHCGPEDAAIVAADERSAGPTAGARSPGAGGTDPGAGADDSGLESVAPQADPSGDRAEAPAASRETSRRARPRAVGGTAPVRAPDPSRAPLRFILYFDLTQSTNEGVNLAYKAALEWAEGGARPDDEVMIVNGGERMRIVRAFLPASQRLREDLLSAREDSRYTERWAEHEASRAAEIITLAEFAGGEVAASVAGSYASEDLHIESRSLRNLGLLMTLFDAVEGPKNLLLFENRLRQIPGRAYPYAIAEDLSRADVDLQRVARAANEREVRIYGVHTEGLAAPGDSMQPDADDAVTFLSSETGGRVYERSNTVVPAFSRVVEDADCFYRVGFHLPRLHSGDLERIEVRVGDGRGYRLRYRRTLLDPTREDQDLDALRAAMLVPAPADAFPLSVVAEPLWVGAKAGRARVEVRIPLANLLALPAAVPTALEARVQVGLTLVPLRPLDPGEARRGGSPWSEAASNRAAWSTARQAIVTLPAAWAPAGDSRSLVLSQEVEAPLGDYRVIAIAQDRVAGVISSTTAYFEITGAETGLGPLHLALPSADAIRVEPAPAETNARRHRDEIAPTAESFPDSLLLAGEPRVESGRRASIVHAVCDPGPPDPDQGAGDVSWLAGWRLTHGLVCGETAIPMGQSSLVPPSAGARCAVVVAPFPAAPLPPGACRAEVTLERPGTPAETRQLDFTVGVRTGS